MTETTTEQPTKLAAVSTYGDMMAANAALMTEIYTDPKLTAAEKLRNFSAGIRNQVALSKDLAARRAEVFRYGLKAEGSLKTLDFNPLADA
jgi:hypothetical protein